MEWNLGVFFAVETLRGLIYGQNNEVKSRVMCKVARILQEGIMAGIMYFH